MSEVSSKLPLTIGSVASFSLSTEAIVSERQAIAEPVVWSIGAKGSYLHRAVCHISIAVS